MAGYYEVQQRWLDRVMGRTTRQNLSNHRMPCNDDAIFSYGAHFPLAVVSRDEKRNPRALILNGERNSVTTAKHQSMTRSMAQQSGLPHVIVPFGALSAAGVDPEDVEIIEATPDREDVVTTVRHALPGNTRFEWAHNVGWIDVDDEEVERRLDANLVERIDAWHASRTSALKTCVVAPFDNPLTAIALTAAAKVFALWSTVRMPNEAGSKWEFGCSWRSAPDEKLWAEPFPVRFTADEMDLHKGGGYTSYQYRNEQWRRDNRRAESNLSLVSGSFGGTHGARWSWEMEAFGFEPDRERWQYWTDSKFPPIDSDVDGMRGVGIGVAAALVCFMTNTPRMTFIYERRRHWLGGSLLRAKIRWTTRRTCKTCEGDGFVGMTREAIDELFGDARWEARNKYRCDACNGTGWLAKRNSRTAYFISDFDANEPRPLYFFCELPRGCKPTTLAEAIEDLKPEVVKVAEQMERPVTRQGDIFAIGLAAITKKELRKRGATFERRGPLLNTNHVATEVARMPDGTTLARGTLTHAPEWRGPDHVRCKMANGKTWHAIVKNTVPVAA